MSPGVLVVGTLVPSALLVVGLSVTSFLLLKTPRFFGIDVS